jgi:hypothetical protein
MVVFSIIFGRFVRVPSEGVPYPVFSLAAMVAWTCFASALRHLVFRELDSVRICQIPEERLPRSIRRAREAMGSYAVPCRPRMTRSFLKS